ncbi:putative secreted protein (type I secretion substrate) [Yoonia maricola]|uniref:Putative secreted protein (Type I secretion substrate) n=1 Tax=Yoonia maricola TaxID=420999 RepID=A0A2M8W107_9RHOB|nr:calcium-binding protein [Yoonia maricola]PJI84595.1 putative secreted protein (type I secretion substrate) [Yoonia maricola]
MSSLSFSFYVTDPGDIGFSHITDLMVVDVGGVAQLYSSTRYDGVLRQWDIESGVLRLGDSDPFAGGLIAGGTGSITSLSNGVLVGGGSGGALEIVSLGTDGGFDASVALTDLPPAFQGFQYGTTLNMSDGIQVVFGALAGQTGLARLTFDAGGALTGHTVLQDATQGTASGIAATTAATVAGQHFIVTASALQNSITARAVDDAGIITSETTINADDGLWVSAPTALEAATVGDSTYLVLAAAGTDSLSVVELGADGSMIVRDHVLDSRDTRFGGVTSLEVITAQGKTYVIAGGADDGISVFLLLEGGLLVHRDAMEDTDDFGLDNISALAAAARNAGIDIFAASSSETGVTQLRFDTGPPGQTFTAVVDGDVLTGTTGGDILQGHDGDDIINGAGGDDILRDGLGSDIMTGGAGADVFILSADGETDTITDFTVGEDKIDLSLWPMLRDISQLFITLQPDGMRIIYGDEMLNVISTDGTPIDYRMLNTADLIGLSRLPVDLRPGYPGPATPTPPLGEPPTEPPTVDAGANNPMTAWQMIKSGNIDLLRGAVSDEAGGMVIDGSDASETITGGAGFDLVFAGGGDDILHGDAGDDALFGRAGNDRLSGDQGADTLLGGAGADILDGGLGQDMLIGGAGADTFIFNSGTDEIADFEQGLDQIILDPSLWTGLTSAADLLFLYADFTDGQAIIDFEDGNVLIINGITDSNAFADDIALF